MTDQFTFPAEYRSIHGRKVDRVARKVARRSFPVVEMPDAIGVDLRDESDV
jgi:hypothetical protein